MAKGLIIVESPAKANTISKFLDNKYKVKASMGHVRDLPPKSMGVDVELRRPGAAIRSNPAQGGEII